MGRTMKFSLALVGLFALVAVTTAYSCNSNTAHTTIKQVITATYAIQASAWATDSTGIKEMSQCAYGKALGIATAASYGCYYTSGCTVSSTAAAGQSPYSRQLHVSAFGGEVIGDGLRQPQPSHRQRRRFRLSDHRLRCRRPLHRHRGPRRLGTRCRPASAVREGSLRASGGGPQPAFFRGLEQTQPVGD